MTPDDLPSDDWTLKQARDWLRERINDGTRCPCCGQMAKVYWRTINSGMAVGAIRLWRAQMGKPHEFFHLPTVTGRRSAEEAKLRYWGLLEEGPAVPGVTKAGYWRLTRAGIDWVTGHTAVPHYVRVFDGKPLGLPTSYSRSGQRKPPVKIRDALGAKFDYDALMRGEA